jgi:hypothetical protein
MDIFEFGKYRDEKILDVILSDPNYCSWLIHQKEFETKNQKMFNFFIKNGINFDPNYEENRLKLVAEKSERKTVYFTFGKYKDSRIEHVFKKDPAYCNYIVNLDNVCKYHKETVDSIYTLQNNILYGR